MAEQRSEAQLDGDVYQLPRLRLDAAHRCFLSWIKGRPRLVPVNQQVRQPLVAVIED